MATTNIKATDIVDEARNASEITATTIGDKRGINVHVIQDETAAKELIPILHSIESLLQDLKKMMLVITDDDGDL